MNDSEKLELLSIHAEVQKLQRDLNKIEDRVKKLLAGITDTPPQQKPNVQASDKNPSLIGQSIHDSIGNIPNVSAAEIKAHTMEYNERITK